VNALLFTCAISAASAASFAPHRATGSTKTTSGRDGDAKNDAAHRKLSAAWGRKKNGAEGVHRRRLRNAREPKGMIDPPIAAIRTIENGWPSADGRRALTEFGVIESPAPLLGRARWRPSHRPHAPDPRHLKSIGHPSSDPVYSGPQWRRHPRQEAPKSDCVVPRQALHAAVLVIRILERTGDDILNRFAGKIWPGWLAAAALRSCPERSLPPLNSPTHEHGARAAAPNRH